ncbi:Glu-tRNA(Gln) amidotransferase subunit GatD [Candidatus Woesearchaeota archaeon]|nr:Glu-tRNA(Gln) amidotransferase subunit GatD [Candidatus Woesearchaeota archaeon]
MAKQDTNPQPGDIVEAETPTEKIKGFFVPSPETEQDTVIIKLQSGYNIGIKKESIKQLTILEKAAHKHAQAHEHAQQKDLPEISILHTGGTIASKVDYRTGGVTAGFTPQEMLNMFPELNSIARITSRQIMQAQSEMMRFAHYNIMAREIEKEAQRGIQGIILTHGTDTMHYTSAALAFMLQDLPIPVIMVGAQRSSDRGSTDAALNLISAAYFIANTDLAEVAICMHETMNDTSCLILPATKTRKMHTSRRDAFRPINTTPIAEVNYEQKKITYMTQPYKKRKQSKPRVTLLRENIKVAIIKTHPNMHADQFLAYRGYDGLIIEGTGLGHIPNQQTDNHTTEHTKIHGAVKTLIKEGTTIVMAPQTVYGRINMKVYSPQRKLLDAGVLGHLSDMTPETALIKLAWLLSNHTKEETRQLITKDLRGEIAERTEIDSFLN